VVEPKASVIVRSRDKVATIEKTLRALRSQSVQAEVIVVDSGSHDGTVDVAERYCDKLIQIASESFSYGGALNIGAEAASGDVHFALSAHCAPTTDDWIERSLELYAREDVAGTNGAIHEPRTKSPLREPYFLELAVAQEDPYWGFSNHAGSWRGSVWREFPFDESLVACEDKEWSWRVMAAGWVIAFDRHLVVDSSHRRREGVRALFQRTRREGRAMASTVDMPRFGMRQAATSWWSDTSPYGRAAAIQRLSHFRNAELLGRYVGEREGRASLAQRRRGGPSD
jgi:rhamnosyltransferase